MQEVEYYIRYVDYDMRIVIIYRLSDSMCDAWDERSSKWYAWNSYKTKKEILSNNKHCMKLANRKYLKLRGVTIK